MKLLEKIILALEFEKNVKMSPKVRSFKQIKKKGIHFLPTISKKNIGCPLLIVHFCDFVPFDEEPDWLALM